MQDDQEEDIIVVDESLQQPPPSDTSINRVLTSEEQLKLDEAKASREKKLAYDERDRKLKEKQALQRQSLQQSGTYKEPSEEDKKADNDEKTKLGILGRVYNGRDGRYGMQRQIAGNPFTRSMLKTLNAGFGSKENFQNNLRAENLARVGSHNKETLANFSGFSGFLNALWLAGTPNHNSSIWMKLYVYGQYLNPFNYFLFASLLIDESTQDLSLVGLKKDESPGVVRMTISGIVALLSGFQRFIVSSACKPLVYAMKQPKIFIAVFLAAVTALNTAVYAFKSKDDSQTDHDTLYDMYRNIAAHIFDNIIIPMLGGMHGKKHDQYPLNMTEHDRHETIQALTAILVNYSALFIASVGSQMSRKAQAAWRGIQLVHDSEENRFVDGVKYGYASVTDAWKQVKTCVISEKPPLTEADVLASLDLAMSTKSNSTNISMHELPAGRDVNNHNNDIQIEGNINNTDSNDVVTNSKTESHNCCVM